MAGPLISLTNDHSGTSLADFDICCGSRPALSVDEIAIAIGPGKRKRKRPKIGPKTINPTKKTMN